MQYRKLGNTGICVSEIGFGGEYLEGKDYPVVEASIHRALDAGVNLIDIFMSEPNVRTNIGRAIEGRRGDVVIQGHFRAVWKNGQYARTLDIDETKFFFEDLLARLKTDYIDIGMLHMIDNDADYRTVFEGPIYEYAKQLKSQGTIRTIGMSSHNPEIALRAVEAGLIDVLLFSLNPAYDLLEQEKDFIGPASLSENSFESHGTLDIDPIRNRLYRTCEAKGIGITVMKSLAAGVLLDEKRSPFGMALSVPQCLHYALTRPAVASVVLGMQTPDEVEEALRYETMEDSERDYTAVFSAKPQFNLKGHCMYCNHCLPCVSHINIAAVNKYLDLAQAEPSAPPTVRAHYDSLEHTAADCIACGACEKRCPFEVPVIERMQRAQQLFGK